MGKTVEQVANIAMAIVSLADVTTLVSSPQTSAIIRASGSAFSGSLRAAMGR